MSPTGTGREPAGPNVEGDVEEVLGVDAVGDSGIFDSVVSAFSISAILVKTPGLMKSPKELPRG